MTIYKAIEYIKQWHYTALNPTEKRFINSMSEASQGIGENPNNEDLKEQCGFSDKQIAFVWKIANRFLITKSSKV